MLNISNNSIRSRIDLENSVSLKGIKNPFATRTLRYFFVGSFALFAIGLFLPWTQNIETQGTLIALNPDERPQTIQNVIPGKIESWHVAEGDYVKTGDTILYISEIKTEYFDPQLIERANQQVNAKASSIDAYENKLKALDMQINSLNDLQRFKIQTIDNQVKQARLRLVSDSAAWKAAELDFKTAKNRLDRQMGLYDKGLISLTDLEEKKLIFQQTQARLIQLENAYGLSMNQFINTLIEQDQVVSEFAEKISDIRSKKSSAGSELYDGLAEMAKMKNQLANYRLRQKLNYVTAPRPGYVTQALEAGIGQNIKEGTPVVTIVPEKWRKAVEVFVSPNDLPLMHVGAKMMFFFDGWPSIVFSGWPDRSYGTFPGKVRAIDYNIGANGMYRVLVEESEAQPWPDELRIGCGVRGFCLLKRVPLWYELWRQINGFPPDYYEPDSKSKTNVQKK